MSAPREFIIKCYFKLVYTDIVYIIDISNHSTLNDLFDRACVKFKPHINYHNYYIDFVIIGQEKGELGQAIDINNLEYPLWYQFRNLSKELAFYVRPINRYTNSFQCIENYNVSFGELPIDTWRQFTYIT